MKINIFKFLKDVLAPKKCYSCYREGHFLCNKCISKIDRFKPFCYVCKNPSDKFIIHEKCKQNIFLDKVIVFAYYRDKIIKKLIKKSKFYSAKDILEDLGEYLGDSFIKNVNFKNKEDYVIVGVPMYFLRKFKRGYNHSELLADCVSLETGIIHNKYLLKRIKNTRQQSTLSKQERLTNLKNCFKININKIDNIDKKTFIIVDDVISTGTTINEIAKILKQAGAKKTIGLILASN